MSASTEIPPETLTPKLRCLLRRQEPRQSEVRLTACGMNAAVCRAKVFSASLRRRDHKLPSERLQIRQLLASSFPAFAALYLLIFAAFGTISPYLPSFLESRSLAPPQLAAVIAAGTIAQLLVGPMAGMAADTLGARRVLAVAATMTGSMALLYSAVSGFFPLLAVGICYFMTIAALNPLADALALNAALHDGRFRYGWVRSVGSAAFIAGLLASSALIARHGLEAVMVAGAGLFLSALGPIAVLPALPRSPVALARGGIHLLVSIPAYRRMLILAALVIGSHATSDTFSVISWRAGGLAPSMIGALSALAVCAEVIVFASIGPLLVNRLGAFRCFALTGMAGALRWAIMAKTTSVPLIAAAQLLHGLTFALTHLACMRVIARHVPERLSATAQALYATSVGTATAVLTLVAGHLYGAFGTGAFWLACALCALAVPLSG